jgi:hypothetical protein
MNGRTTTVFARWKREMTWGAYNLMLKRLILCLLQARVSGAELFRNSFHRKYAPPYPPKPLGLCIPLRRPSGRNSTHV